MELRLEIRDHCPPVMSLLLPLLLAVVGAEGSYRKIEQDRSRKVVMQEEVCYYQPHDQVGEVLGLGQVDITHIVKFFEMTPRLLKLNGIWKLLKIGLTMLKLLSLYVLLALQ